MGANHAEGLRFAGRQHIPRAAIGSRSTRQRIAFRNDSEQGEAIDGLQVLRLPDPAVEALEQEGDAKPQQQAQHGPDDCVPRDLRRGGTRRHRGRLRKLDVAGLQPGKDPQRLCATLEGKSSRSSSLLRGERRQLLVHQSKRGADVPVGAALLLLDELPAVGVGDRSRKRRRSRGGRNVDHVCRSYRGYAQAALDPLRRQPMTEQACGLRRRLAKLKELDVGRLLTSRVVADSGLQSSDLLAELVFVEDHRRRRGVFLGLLLGDRERGARRQDDAEKYPRRASTQDAQRPLEIDFFGSILHSAQPPSLVLRWMCYRMDPSAHISPEVDRRILNHAPNPANRIRPPRSMFPGENGDDRWRPIEKANTLK